MSVRLIVTGMVIPGVLGIGAMAAIVIPRGEHELSWPRLLSGLAAMLVVQVVGGYVAGRLSVRAEAKDLGPDCERCGDPTGKPFLYNNPRQHWRCEPCEQEVTGIIFRAASEGYLTDTMRRYIQPLPEK